MRTKPEVKPLYPLYHEYQASVERVLHTVLLLHSALGMGLDEDAKNLSHPAVVTRLKELHAKLGAELGND